MSIPVDVQLREYSSFLETQLPDIDVADVLSKPAEIGSMRPAHARILRRSPNWLSAAAAAVVVLILVGGASLMTRSRSTDSATDRPANESPSPHANESTLLPPTDSTAWSEHEPRFKAEQPPESLTDAATTPFGLFAAGFGGSAPVWRSEDGIEWTPVGADSIEYRRPEFSHIEGSGLGLLLISPGNGTWFSADGADWVLVPDLEIRRNGLGFISVMAASQRGFLVAVERTLWFSPNGLDWTQTDGSFVGASEANRVAANGDAFYAIADKDTGTVWRSVDGVAWEPLPLGAVIDMVCDLAASDLGVVFIGCDPGRGGDTIWFSPNGRSWTRATETPELGDRILFRTGGSDIGFLATTEGHSEPLTAWYSADGRTWTLVRATSARADFSVEIAYEVLPFEDGFVAIGERFGDSPQRSRVWIYAP